MCTVPWLALSAALEISEIISFGAYWSKGLATTISGATEKYFLYV